MPGLVPGIHVFGLAIVAAPTLLPTTANCRSRLRWSTEKLSSDTIVMTVSPPAARWMDNSFHVIDLIGEIGLDH